jgi:hypothetical protein
VSGPAKGQGRGGKARGYSWPPFVEGNSAAEKHGAFSDRRVDPLAAIAAADLVDAAPWLAAPGFGPAVEAWSRTEARVALIDAYLARHGPLDDEGKPRPATELLVKFERLAADLRGRLGLDPASRARIERDLAAVVRDFDVVAATAEGRRLRIASEETK